MTEYAFPDPHLTHIKGMSLRDYFAAKAMAALMVAAPHTSYYNAAESAYKQADAMMKERANDTSTR